VGYDRGIQEVNMLKINDKKIAQHSNLVEIVFWVAAITVVLFINISPQALRTTSPAYLIIFLVALLVILAINLLPNIEGRKNKILFSSTVYAIVFLAVYLYFKGLSTWLIYYYLPIVIALTMAFIVIVRSKGSITLLVAVCTFLLGEAFWNIHVGEGKKIQLPTGFIRFYSLSLVTLFGYYLYSRELRIQKDLRELNQRLKTLDSMKSEFVANVSHELRTPLTSIKNACLVLKKMSTKGCVTPDASPVELLDIIDANVDRQSRLINNLLDLAKIEQGAIKAQRALIDLSGIVKQVVSSLSMQAKTKGIKFDIDIQPDAPKIYASADQMSEVFTNLINNAIKYNKQDGVISIKITKELGGIKAVIKDTGIGIKSEDIGKLFDRFKRLETILGNRTKGAGLGLAITRQIIDSHLGKIWIESIPGEGSSFIFTLPVGLRDIDKRKGA